MKKTLIFLTILLFAASMFANADLLSESGIAHNSQAPTDDEWIHWDDGVNYNSLGLTAGDFMVASRWDPAALAPYDGMDLTKVNFFPCSDLCTYEINIWTGANAASLVLNQAVPTFTIDTWNEIVLDTPITIDATDELWFGYAIIGQPAGEHPAGYDAGPAIAGYGDMITMDGGATWDPLSGVGLDYNWNLQGYVEEPSIPAVFFSEYIEGSSNNKGLEIYNNEGVAINLDDFRINQSVNGGGWQYQHYFPTGATLDFEDVWCICTDQADPALQDVADEILAYPSVSHHNGNDARGLEWTPDGGTTWIMLDLFGDPDNDPGVGWDVAGVVEGTKDHTLVRKDEIAVGNTVVLGSFGTDPTDSEWIVHPQDTFDYFGWHIIEPTQFDPPSNVAVDGESGIVTWDPPPLTIYTDDFEAYNVGEYLAVQSADWTTWSFNPGSAEDGFVSDDYALSGTKSVKVDGTTDLVLIMEDYYTGRYSMDVNLYIPEGYCGYYNLQKTSTPGEEWGIQTMFDVDGIASIDGDGAAACTFPFDFDTWMNFVIIVDLDVDLCEFYYNGTLMHSYQWTLGCFGQGTLTSLGGMNMYAWASTGNSPLYYFDDVTLSETYGGTTRDHIGYNVYLDGVLQTIPPLGIDVFSYEYEGLIPDQAYVAGVSALYDDGESEIIEVEFIYTPVTTFDPPENLVATVVNYNEVELAWQPPGGGAGEWIHWDDGINNNAIGLVSGGSFLVASRWDPANLADYDGWDLMKVNFFPCDDMCTYEIKVWTGANAANLVLDQAVTTFVVDTWNEIILDTPITIDATDELWFGYGIVNHAAGTHPAGCDAGPAVAGFGDMISLDGVTWDSLSGLGFDFNWNLQGYVFGSDGETVAMNKKAEVGVERISTPIVEKRVLTRINSNLLSCAPTHGTRLTAEQSRDDRYLSGYKVYRDGEEIAEITDPLVLTYSDDEGLDAGDYEYYVTAIYEAPAGESDPCDSVIVTITLPAPVDVFAESVFPNIMVTWEVPPLPTRGLSHYKVYRDMVLIVDNVTGLFHIDINVPEGTYSYTVVAVYDGGWDSEHSEPYVVEHYVDAGDILIPIRTELTGNYPNPFNPATTINFALKEAGNVTIMVYNVKGEKVRNLVDCRLEAAYHSIVWDGKDNTGRNVSSGVYFYKMKAEKYSSTKKMILMK